MSDLDPVSLLQPAATRVRDPLSGRSVWLAGLVKNARVDNDVLAFDLVFEAGHSMDDRLSIAEAITKNLRGLGYTGRVSPRPQGPPSDGSPQGQPSSKPKAEDKSIPGMNMQGGVQPHGGPISKQNPEGVGHIIAVASGKGGVGKSTVATNLAVALQKLGHQTGLLDLDVYGPSLPVMMNTTQRPLVDEARKIVPVNAYGVRCISMGLLVDAEQAMIWRGPMVMGVLRQFLQDVRWSGVDYLIVDLPPGTGDAQLSLVQAVQLAGAVIVTTPQDVALADAVRGISMFRKLDVPLLGLVENMAYYQLPDGTKDYVFGQDGGKRTAKRYDTELLGQIPLQTSLRKSGDDGIPAALGDDETARVFQKIAERVAAQLPVGA